MGERLADEKQSPYRTGVIRKMNIFPLVENLGKNHLTKKLCSLVFLFFNLVSKNDKKIEFVQESDSDGDDYFEDPAEAANQEKSRFHRTFGSQKMASKAIVLF
jgi:hypothetical protein